MRRSLRRGWHNWALGLLCLIVIGVAVSSIGSSSADSATTRRTATVERGVVQSTVSGNGSLEPSRQVELDFGASGEVTDIHAKAGEKVSKGEVLARIDSSSARASLASAEAQLSEAEETLEAAEEPEAETTSSESSAEAKPGEPESSSPAGGTVSVATAEAKLRQARLSVKSARREIRETALRAPISGTVASVSRSSKSSGGMGSSVSIVLIQLSRLKMKVSFSESDVGKVEAGQPATVSVSSVEGTELAGRVTKVDVLPSESSSSGVVEYPATITVTQSAKGVRAGMSASAEVVVEQASNTLAVSSEAIASGSGGGSVTVLEDGREVDRSVTTGLKGDETTQILSGLEAGETVVLPEITAAAGGVGSAGALPEGGAIPGGGSLPNFGSGGPPAGFPGAP
jgi:macrolide-specific efflux system membrane fusion protein